MESDGRHAKQKTGKHPLEIGRSGMSAFVALDERAEKKDMKKAGETRHYKGEEHRLNSLWKKPGGSSGAEARLIENDLRGG